MRPYAIGKVPGHFYDPSSLGTIVVTMEVDEKRLVRSWWGLWSWRKHLGLLLTRLGVRLLRCKYEHEEKEAP